MTNALNASDLTSASYGLDVPETELRTPTEVDNKTEVAIEA